MKVVIRAVVRLVYSNFAVQNGSANCAKSVLLTLAPLMFSTRHFSTNIFHGKAKNAGTVVSGRIRRIPSCR